MSNFLDFRSGSGLFFTEWSNYRWMWFWYIPCLWWYFLIVRTMWICFKHIGLPSVCPEERLGFGLVFFLSFLSHSLAFYILKGQRVGINRALSLRITLQHFSKQNKRAPYITVRTGWSGDWLAMQLITKITARHGNTHLWPQHSGGQDRWSSVSLRPLWVI